jgi:ketosteroid isomerase-like protein
VWEAVALSIAKKSGIPVPQSRVESLAGKPVLLLRRFDRDGERTYNAHRSWGQRTSGLRGGRNLKSRKLIGAMVIVLALVGAALGQTSGKETDAILAADAAWLTVYQAKDLAKSVAFCDEHGSMLAPNAPIAVGKDAIAKLIAEDFAHDYIEWHANKVGVSRSGDLGYTSGTTGMTFKDASGKTVAYKGKYLTVWKKQVDSSWKVLYDMFNSDLSATP